MSYLIGQLEIIGHLKIILVFALTNQFPELEHTIK